MGKSTLHMLTLQQFHVVIEKVVLKKFEPLNDDFLKKFEASCQKEENHNSKKDYER